MKKIIKRILFVIALILALLVLFVVSILVIFPIMNNITLSSFSKQLYEWPLPKYTELIEEKAVCGKLNGNGNGMDFFACILIKSDISIEQIKQYYNDKEFKPAKKDKEHAVNVEVTSINGEQLSTDYVLHQDIYFTKLKNINNYTDYYVVMIYDGGYSANFDIRGN